MMKNYYALILAGGGGTRLWPMSRQSKPKQMLPLIGAHSMFRTAVLRLDPLFTPDRIYVSTAHDYVESLRAEAPSIPEENFVVEPSARNNAAAVGLALSVIQKRDPNAVVAMLTADHHIGKIEVFRAVLEAAYQIAVDKQIVTLGISPAFPSTGFGYIQQGAKSGQTLGFDYYVAARFHEKPDVVRATQFVASGQYSWNSGMFIWHIDKAMSEFERQQPAMHELLRTLQLTVDTDQFSATLNNIWEQMPRISIDYAIMEGAKDMTVIPVDIGWSDVGTWSSLYEVLEQDKFGNCGKNGGEKRIVLDAHNSLVFTDKLTVAIGVENIVVVETDDVLMICHKDRAQDVKEIVDYLRANGMTDYL
jgi:mannose-1-phosphate guanylyltransferase